MPSPRPPRSWCASSRRPWALAVVSPAAAVSRGGGVTGPPAAGRAAGRWPSGRARAAPGTCSRARLGAGERRLEPGLRLAAGADDLDVPVRVHAVGPQQFAQDCVVATAELAACDRLADQVGGRVDALADPQDVRLATQVHRQEANAFVALAGCR